MQSPSNYHYYKRSILLGALAGFGIAVIFAGGFFFRGFLDTQYVQAAASEDAHQYPLLNEVQVLINAHYLREQPSVVQREYAAIRGMLGALNDRYTFFIDPPVAQSESDAFAGTYGGIGVQVARAEDGLLILYPLPDSPALAAGIEDGDVLIAINDAPVDFNMQQDAVDQMLRGEVKEGSGVTITVIKRGEEFSTFIPFAVINTPSVLWRVLAEDSRIGFIQILRFTSRTPEELKTAIQELDRAGIDGLVLDLRDNPGGLLKESVDVASEFLDGGVVVYEVSNQGERPLEAAAGGLALDIPLVVLVNQNTASAAELVAGAIRDRTRGIMIGQTTYGKGTVQQIFRLSDDSSLHITSDEWLTPNRSHLDGVGLEPDIIMIPDVNGRDVELGEAVRQLSTLLVEQE